MNRVFSLSILIALSLPFSVFGEIYLCDGAWTNKECEQAPERSMGEIPSVIRSQHDIDMDKKNIMLHDLKMKMIFASRKHDVTVGIEDTEELCRSFQSSISECRREILKKEIKLDERVLASIKIAQGGETKVASSDIPREQRNYAVQVNTNPATCNSYSGNCTYDLRRVIRDDIRQRVDLSRLIDQQDGRTTAKPATNGAPRVNSWSRR